MTLGRWRPPRLISRRSPDQRTVDWLELFYDLIYVAALIELGQTLVGDLSLRGIGRFVALFTLLWWAWVGTTFLMNRIDVDDLAHRWLMVSQMFAIGVLAVIVDDAFGAYSAGFALAYFFIRLSLVVMYGRVWLHIPRARPLAASFLVVNGLSTTLWLVSVVVPPPGRFWLWALAFLIDLSWIASPWVRRNVARDYPPDEAHMAERFALFTLIVLGESIIKIIGGVADFGATADTLVHGALAFLVVGGLWWTYFDDVADSPINQMVRLNTATWTFLHLPLTMGLTAVGVALSGLVLSAIGASLDASTAWLLIGALLLVFGSVAGLDAITTSPHHGLTKTQRIIPTLGAMALLVPLGLATPLLTSTAFLVAVSVIVIGQIAIEVILARRADAAMRVEVEQVMRSAAANAPCDHLTAIEDTQPASAGCLQCTENGLVWVHLRACTICGQVGCCDDSPGRHALKHYLSHEHATMRSIETGEEWAWCYEDRVGLESVTDAYRGGP
jgi:low temperature requirement protein LtrA